MTTYNPPPKKFFDLTKYASGEQKIGNKPIPITIKREKPKRPSNKWCIHWCFKTGEFKTNIQKCFISKEIAEQNIHKILNSSYEVFRDPYTENRHLFSNYLFAFAVPLT